MPVDARGWEAYREVNDAFAEVVIREHRAGDLIWIHDYHLMLLPALIRERVPNARIGFFLHIPFPSSEVFRVLVLSEFAGAAAELDGALVINRYDVEAVADGMERALGLTIEECRTRIKGLRRRVREYDVHAWASAFIAQLDAARRFGRSSAIAPEPSLVTALSDARQAEHVRLLLDYDGTLVPFARSPELAAPDGAILSLLAEIAALPGVDVDIVSGRPRETLEEWFGSLPLALWAEHGFWHRPSPETPWCPAANVDLDWMTRLRPILEQFTARTPGSRIELKSASVAWHHRGAQPEFGSRQAHELSMLLGDALRNQPVEVLEGNKVIEVRLRGISKAVVADQIERAAIPDTAVTAIGDDRTDEDLFRALPRSCVTVAIGGQSTCARFRVEDYRAVRALLRRLLPIEATPVEDGRRGYPMPFASTA